MISRPHAPDPTTLAALFGVSERTARRWRETGLTPAQRRIVDVMVWGDIGALRGGWPGWRLVDGLLYAPTGARPYRPGDVLALELTLQRVRAQAAALRERREAPLSGAVQRG